MCGRFYREGGGVKRSLPSVSILKKPILNRVKVIVIFNQESTPTTLDSLNVFPTTSAIFFFFFTIRSAEPNKSAFMIIALIFKCKNLGTPKQNYSKNKIPAISAHSSISKDLWFDRTCILSYNVEKTVVFNNKG